VDLQYDPTQVMLRDTAERFLKQAYDHRKFRQISESDAGFSADIWKEFADLGWLGLPFAESDGGIGGGAVEIAILMEAFGRSLVVEPYIPTVVLGGGLVAALGDAKQRAEMLPAIAEGKLKLAFADAENGMRTRAKLNGSGYVLSGGKHAVLAAPQADILLISARLASGGTGVFAVPVSTSGLNMRPYRTIDGGRAADIDMVDVAVPRSALLGGNENAGQTVVHEVDRAIAASSADAVGAIATMVQATVDYTKTRVQFGQPLAKFQALQFRMVEMKVKEEEARASCLFATLSLDGPADKRARAVSGAKAKIGRCARFVAQNAIQTHGAIGTTDELSLGAYAKRLMAYEINFGATRDHLRRYAALIAKPDTAGASLLLDPARS
jgi:alkylation response protein AidB-like acyl-CoA dehydrogenase